MNDLAPPALRPSALLWSGMAVVVFGVAIAGYAITGSPGRASSATGSSFVATPAVPAPAATVDTQVTDIVDRMARRLAEQPGDAAGWALLARAYAATSRPMQAVPAFQKAVALNGDDATLLADYADTLAARDNGQFSAEAVALIERALALDPNDLKAMALAGSVAFDRREYIAAVRRWEQVERRLPADSKMLPQVRASMAQARQLGGLPPP